MTYHGSDEATMSNSVNTQVCTPDETKTEQIDTRDDINEQSSVQPTCTVPDLKNIKKLPTCLPMLQSQLSQVHEKKRIATVPVIESESSQELSKKRNRCSEFYLLYFMRYLYF
jgi:hypothetical protein